MRIGVAYGSDVQLVTELLRRAADEHSGVLKDPAYSVIFDDFGDNALIFELNVWVYAIADRSLRVIRSDLRYRIDELFRDNDVTISFPQRDVHVDGQIMLRQESGTRVQAGLSRLSQRAVQGYLFRQSNICWAWT